jgi:hypothetical protein
MQLSDVSIFFNIGAMKSATSWLFINLRKNGSLITFPEKEIHWHSDINSHSSLLSDSFRLDGLKRYCSLLTSNPFETPSTIRDFRWYQRYLTNPVDLEWYKNLFFEDYDDKFVADFSNTYCLLTTDNWKHIKSSYKRVRISYLMRNPFDRFLAHLAFELLWNKIDDTSVNLSRSNLLSIIERSRIFDHSDYTAVIRRLNDVFSDDDIKITTVDDIKIDPVSVLYLYERFLGLSHRLWSREEVSKPENVTPFVELPRAAKDIAASFCERQLEQLAAMNLAIPPSWQNYDR